MAGKTLIVIGAGLAGLSTGIYAQMNGFSTRVFEHASQPGGVSATWRRKDYLIDGGVHFYMGYAPGQPVHRYYRELGVDQLDQYRPLSHYARYLDLAAGRQLDLTADLDRLAVDLKALAPRDAGFIDGFIAGAQTFRGGDAFAGLDQPPELQGWFGQARLLWSQWKRLKYFGGRSARPVKEAVRDLHDPWLAEVLQYFFLPEVPFFFLLMLLGCLADGNSALRLDGSAGFARALERRFLDLGGQVTYQATVDQILVENDAAVGVRLKDGEVFKADRVVSAADGHQTLFHLLGGRYLHPTLAQAHAEWPLFNPLVLVSFGLNREFPNDPWSLMIKPTRPVEAGFLSSRWWSVRIFNYSPVFAPPGKTVLQVMADSAWRPWADLRADLPAYKAEKDRLAAQVLERLEERWPGLARAVEVVDVATPYTTWRYTLNRQGAYEGFMITARNIRARIPRRLPGLKNFCLAGQWVSPGGGVVPSLLTGRHAVMLLCRQDGRAFQALGRG